MNSIEVTYIGLQHILYFFYVRLMWWCETNFRYCTWFSFNQLFIQSNWLFSLFKYFFSL